MASTSPQINIKHIDNVLLTSSIISTILSLQPEGGRVCGGEWPGDPQLCR